MTITCISCSTNYWYYWCYTVSKSIRMESRFTVRWCWNWSWSWCKYLISSWNWRIVWRICWYWNPDTISLTIRSESTSTRYLWIFIWDTVSFTIREIFTWTSRNCFQYSWNTASRSITNKSSIAYNWFKWNNTISISVTFISTWANRILDYFWWNIHTSPISIKFISLRTCQ